MVGSTGKGEEERLKSEWSKGVESRVGEGEGWVGRFKLELRDGVGKVQ